MEEGSFEVEGHIECVIDPNNNPSPTPEPTLRIMATCGAQQMLMYKQLDCPSKRDMEYELDDLLMADTIESVWTVPCNATA